MPWTPDEFVKQLHWRYAVKKFDATKKIPADVWHALEQTLVLTPSSYGLQPWRFVVITDQNIKDQLVPRSWGQRQPGDCSHMVVFATHVNLNADHVDRHIARTSELRGTPIESMAGLRKMILGTLHASEDFDLQHWAALQVYIALGNFMTGAAVLGIDTCPMEGIEIEKYNELLGLAEQGFQTVVGAAAGYRAPDDKYASMAKVRFKHEEVIQRI